MKTTQILEAKAKITVLKTKKTYHHTFRYAKHVITQQRIIERGTHEYFLRDGRKWRQVTEEEFNVATSEEALSKLYDKLAEELKQRVEREMA